jgi:hypothetical protein
MAEVEKEHPLAKMHREKREAKALAEQEKANPKNTEVVDETIETPKDKEPTVSLSEVQRLIEEALSKQTQQLVKPIVQQIPQHRLEQDIDDDIPEFKNWEMKDRQYVLCDGSKPISYSIAHQHSEHMNLQYTNKARKTVHTLRFASNQPSFFVENQSKELGSVLVKHIIFKNGMLKVGANDVVLQKFLTIHPHNGIIFKEYDPTESSRKFVADKKLKNKANMLVDSVGNTINRAIASLVCPSYVEAWGIDQIEEEMFLYADSNPKEYIELCENPDTKVKGIAKSAISRGLLIYKNYRFYNANKELLIEVDRNSNEIDVICKYLQTGDGRSFYEYLANSLN